MKYIDLRSDTVTKLTLKMREEMMKAEVGDDVFSDDPTMNALEIYTAELFGKEAAIFVPSGTFSNQLALFTHCKQGDEVIVDQFAHIVQHESGASPIISGVQLFTLESNGGIWDLEKLEKMIKVRTISTTRTKLVCMENAYGGKVLPLDYMEKVFNISKKHGLSVHLDGARIFNAATALKVHVREMAKYAEKYKVKPKTILKLGRVVDTIVQVADDEKIDQIIIGKTGLTGIRRMLMGHVAEDVAKYAGCRVTVVPE